MTDDTIVAPATPLGRSALAIVRIDEKLPPAGRHATWISSERLRTMWCQAAIAAPSSLTANCGAQRIERGPPISRTEPSDCRPASPIR